MSDQYVNATPAQPKPTKLYMSDAAGFITGVMHLFPDGIEVLTTLSLANDNALIAEEYARLAALASTPNLDLGKPSEILTESEPITDFITFPGTPHIRGTTPKPITAYQAPNHPPQVEIVSEALTTAGPDFSLIPLAVPTASSPAGTEMTSSYQHCPSCNDHGTTLQLGPDSGSRYCPRCNVFFKENPPPQQTEPVCPACSSTSVERILHDFGLICLVCHKDWPVSREVYETVPLRVFQAPGHPAQVEIVPGALSTPTHAYHLIPKIVIDELADRFSLGEVRKGDKAWNAHSTNQHILVSREFIVERLNHVIAHCFLLIGKVKANDTQAMLADNDAAAIAWGGAFAIAARAELLKETNSSSPSTP